MESVLLNDRYRLLELVGSGGMAAVYRGLDTLLQRQVAVKVLREGFASDPAFLARFQREARAAARLDHPNVVTVYDVGQDGGRHYIVMEYVDGQDLKALIRRKGRLSVNESLDLAIQVCDGVGHAHKAEIIHCDVKPQNVLVTSDGRAKVTDFGIARALSESGVTESDTVWGSPHYFSPEQAAGETPSPASDVYSIGIMIYEMLAGAPPFQAEKPTALALMHMREEPQPLVIQNPQVPDHLESIVRKVLAKEPSARYRNAEQFGHILEEYRYLSEQMTGWQSAISAPPPAAPVPAVQHPEVRPSSEPRPTLDGPSWVLGAIAFIAVVGLIPLWGSVYSAYSAPPSLPATPTPVSLVTFTPETQLLSVPNIVGKPIEEAGITLERSGLRLVVLEERDEPGAKGKVVLEQTPSPGETVPPDGEVSVVVSRARRELEMPGVTDYPVEMIQSSLEADGLHVIVERVWSSRQDGTILEQEPDQNTAIHTGDTVTLTVSGGVDTPIQLDVNLADMVVLETADLRQQTFHAGEVIAVTLHWQVLRPINRNYVAFVHLISSDGQLVTQQDKEPDQPTAQWVPDMEPKATHEIAVPPNLLTGLYQLRTGWYPAGEPGNRLAVVDAGSTQAEANSILIAEIEISR